MPASQKPSLTLTTPVTASFPADALKSAASVRSPLSAAAWREPLPSAGLPSAGLPSAGLPSAGLPSAGLPSAGIISPHISNIKLEDALVKTPITPPMAYMDFLKKASPAAPSPSLASPPLTGKAPLNRTSTMSSGTSDKSANSSGSEDADRDKEIETAPSTATSVGTDCTCDCELSHKSPKASTASMVPPSPFTSLPMSAPATGPTTFSSLKVPASPVKGVDSPVRSPFSARSVRSPFDWEAALKAKRQPDVVSKRHTCDINNKPSIRHIREVVTRTVTYTPRMEPAPKGKRRRVE